MHDNADPMDDQGHGTHVAGTAAGNGKVRGIAPHADLYGLKVLGSNGGGNLSDVVAALEWAVNPDGDPTTNDALDVVNLSLSGGGYNGDPMSVAANNAMDAGVIVVAAAGNNGQQGYASVSVNSPAIADKIITVGATDYKQ